MTIAIAGASGFVGRALTVRLLESNHDVLALHRSEKTAVASERTVVVDLGDDIATARALTNVDAAFYLVHSMADGDAFRDLDLRSRPHLVAPRHEPASVESSTWGPSVTLRVLLTSPAVTRSARPFEVPMLT